ncbi:uncharacterized protein [Phaseolus vulgaris]|uniref:DUF7787 domain-containing protein n=1 Tax=Phaseolus vulgaris TaxID=3885 RepID=V7AL51_PHAVU|nr:hypothetical protein PHAVU_011G131000g [Phaseolus vulgaris]ESW04856.1 hypothetical protein PHAVU_011G131000g [Phaseolus vulgaris]
MAEELATTIPQSQGSSMKKRPSKKDKVLLEDYLHLLHSRQTLHLTINQLNQVIRIHGFKKIHHAPKKVLVEAVESLDLVNVPRSTLCDSVSAFAAVALEDVVADLAELKWQECCVTSVERISLSEGKSVLPASSDQSFGFGRQSKRMDETRDLIPENFQGRLKPTKMAPKRKKSKVAALDSVASAVDSASLASC